MGWELDPMLLEGHIVPNLKLDVVMAFGVCTAANTWNIGSIDIECLVLDQIPGASSATLDGPVHMTCDDRADLLPWARA